MTELGPKGIKVIEAGICRVHFMHHQLVREAHPTDRDFAPIMKQDTKKWKKQETL
jgi:hypothetical protein